MKTLFIISLFLFINYCGSAQIAGNTIDYSRLTNTMYPDEQHHKYNYKGVNSEVDFVFTSLFIFYKSFIFISKTKIKKQKIIIKISRKFII